MAASEEIWMPEKVHNHDRKSAYGMMVKVRIGGEVSDTFAITNSAYWLPRFSLSYCQQCLKRLSETWGKESTSNYTIMQTSLQFHTSERKQKPQIYLRENGFLQTTAH